MGEYSEKNARIAGKWVNDKLYSLATGGDHPRPRYLVNYRGEDRVCFPCPGDTFKDYHTGELIYRPFTRVYGVIDEYNIIDRNGRKIQE